MTVRLELECTREEFDRVVGLTGSPLFVDGGWTVSDGRYTPPT